MPTLLIAGLVGLLVVGMIIALMMALAKPTDARASERLDALVGRKSNVDSSADMLLKQALQEVDKKNLLDRLTPGMFNLPKMIDQADANVKPSTLVGIGLLAAAVCGILAGFLVNMYVAPIVAGVMFLVPFIWLFIKRMRRLNAFANQLPECMELIARALRAGHSLAAGLHVVSEEMPLPVSKEFGRVYEEQNLGITIDDALANLLERVPNLDLKFFVTSVVIQRQTGGDLAEILDRIGHIIRERIKILGQVKALTAEGRLSGIVLVALPVGLFILMLFMKPDYIELLWKDPMGVQMSIMAIVMMCIGTFAIMKIVDIKV
jgi:tight adherence protein B